MKRYLRVIMNVSRMNKITNVEILCRTGLPSMIKKNVRLLGHVLRMDNNRLPKQLLYSQFCLGMRNQGRPRLRFKDVAKRNMKWRDIVLNRWQESANCRPTRRRLIKLCWTREQSWSNRLSVMMMNENVPLKSYCVSRNEIFVNCSSIY